ncbi:hypothetical protein ACE1ET_09220 [Saccharicrinis sp. FJH62]|uniref:hypothetical protein n=1 Tax=Saccharicrinis sp. FJH62 TaxID=3344657 RepID=UPI0035D4E679
MVSERSCRIWSTSYYISRCSISKRRYFSSLSCGNVSVVSNPVAFIAVAGRGIILPIAFVILVLILSQFLAMAGFGPYFPWAIPGVFTVSDPAQGMALVNTSYVILILTFALGITGTVLWWRYADQK